VTANYRGGIASSTVIDTFGNYDLFLFPTLGENFGHVIAESLHAGTPVLLSEGTPWNDLETSGAGWILPLANPSAFTEKIEELAAMPVDARAAMRRRTRDYVLLKCADEFIIGSNRKMFQDALALSDPEKLA
jgi:glycosyltransferase involved in cell wall biosynthesis